MDNLCNFIMVILAILIIGIISSYDSEGFCDSYGIINKASTDYKKNKCFIKVNNQEVPLYYYILIKD